MSRLFLKEGMPLELPWSLNQSADGVLQVHSCFAVTFYYISKRFLSPHLWVKEERAMGKFLRQTLDFGRDKKLF